MKDPFYSRWTYVLYLAWLLWLVLATAGALAAEAGPAPDRVAPNCTFPADIDKHLAGAGQDEIASLVSRGGWVLRIYGRPNGGGWTIIRIMPTGCGYGVDGGPVWTRPDLETY